MTIDEYLNQMLRLKSKSDQLLNKWNEAETRATSPRDPLNLGDGTPRSRSGDNAAESKLLEYIDAGRAYKEANQQFKEMRDAVNLAIDDLKYWQGCLIHHVYIYNVYFNYEDLFTGADEILHTRNRQQIQAKLTEAKAALADQLRAQGVEIE